MNNHWPLRNEAAFALLVVLASACAAPSPTATPATVEAPSVAPPGTISGKILGEASDPNLRVYARDIHSGHVYWISPEEGSFTYTIPNLPAGTYVVVGWFHPTGTSGAYTSLDNVNNG